MRYRFVKVSDFLLRCFNEKQATSTGPAEGLQNIIKDMGRHQLLLSVIVNSK